MCIYMYICIGGGGTCPSNPEYCSRAKWERLERIEGLRTESPGRNLAATVFHLPNFLDSRVKIVQLKTFQGLGPESRGWNLTVIVLHLHNLLDSREAGRPRSRTVFSSLVFFITLQPRVE